MRKKIIFLLFISISVFALLGQEKSIVLKTETGNLDGTLLIPSKPKKVPIVVLISGSGPTDRDGNNPEMKNNSLKMLANALYDNGIATLRFDKRGTAESTLAIEDEASLRFETYINDVCDWVDLISENPKFTNIFIAGHSEGSLIGMVAARKNKKVNGYISISGAGFPADEILRKQLQVQLSEDYMIQANAMLDTLKWGSKLQLVPADFYILFRPSVQPYLISWFKYNPKQEISILNIPSLLINGGRDIQVGTENLEELINSQPNAESVIIPTMNHVLKNCKSTLMKDQLPTYKNPNIPINTTLVDVIVGFIERNRE